VLKKKSANNEGQGAKYFALNDEEVETPNKDDIKSNRMRTGNYSPVGKQRRTNDGVDT
jgi:hypothetical protein